ncbi:FAD-dependent oxidoreductase [Tumidithrix elongata RA019]|uniref:FAD-dependent oxidoreductase n=1 Tax=Tumidithrix elongata BACA0141 TaxID=2716417 RepID=A0AAW9PXS3_9CYAN|nr:FAD-dependent oxidoreductase [Tumidithrix elongata RA019]
MSPFSKQIRKLISLNRLKPWQAIASIPLGLALAIATGTSALAAPPRTPDQNVECEILIVGGGLAGTATAYEALLAGRTVCITDITDWIGGQLTSQGTSALDESKKQRSLLFYARGYKELRDSLLNYYGKINPGDCWVSASCFIPSDANKLLFEILDGAAKKGGGQLKWFPNTTIKELEVSSDGKIIDGAIAIQHRAAPNTPPLNTEPLSAIVEDAYRYENSPRLTKTILHFTAKPSTETKSSSTPKWYVVEATETGEIIALADVPYRLGIDPLSHLNPSSPSAAGDPFCTQGFTYTFALQQTEQPQPQTKPSFYDRYLSYYSYDPKPNKFDFDSVFTYRRIWAPNAESRPKATVFRVGAPAPQDISMQNWVWGNDYRPGTSEDNLIYSREQLQQLGQLVPGSWMGGLRTETLRKGEEIALGFYYWLVAGTTDSHLGDGVKKPYPNHLLLTGLNSPMGTMHGLSKYPYIREGRRIVGRPSFGYADGFTVSELDISRHDYREDYYRQNLTPKMYRDMWVALAGLESVVAVRGASIEQISRRTRSSIYPDAVGISQYAIDFHPCMTLSPPEAKGNTERAGVRQAHGMAFPAQIPLRAMIPQKIDNLIVASKSIAVSNIAAAAYRVHSFEWSVGAAAGTTVSFALEKGIPPFQLVEDMPRVKPELMELRDRLEKNGNPTAFPDTSVFNLSWDDWKVW